MDKFIKSFLPIFLMAFGILTAKADVSFTITTEDASHIKVYYEVWDSPSQSLIPEYFEPEGNVFSIKVADDTRIKVAGVNPWSITSIKLDNGNDVEGIYITNNVWSLTADNTLNKKNLNVEVVNEDLNRTNSFTFNVDDAAAIEAYLGMGNRPNSYKLEFKDGENTIKYNPATEGKMSVFSKDYDTPLYSVTVDNTSIHPDEYGWYIFSLTDGCSVDVVSVVPEGDATISFTYSEGGAGCIEKVLVDGEPVEMSDEIIVADGSVITLFKSENFDIHSWRIGNAEAKEWSGVSNEFSVAGDTEIYFEATARKFFDYTVIVNDASLLSLYRQDDDYKNIKIDLVSGENKLRIPEANPQIFWVAEAGNIIESVYVTLEGGEAELYTQASIPVEEGMLIEFSVRAINRDQTAVIWCDGIENNGGVVKTRFYENICELEDGYNVFNFDKAENPLIIDTHFISTNPQYNFFYLNGEKLTPIAPPYPSYKADFADLSVGKFFLASRPVDCQVSFEIAENVDVEVIRDVIVPVTDFSAPINCFEGTEFTIIPESPVIVSIDGDEIDPEEDGNYIIETNDNYTISIEKGIDVGVVDVTDEYDSGMIYNLFGMSLGKVDNINKLPAGFYIIGGKKVIVK